MITTLVAVSRNLVHVPIMFWKDYQVALEAAINLLGEMSDKRHWFVYKISQRLSEKGCLYDDELLILPPVLYQINPQVKHDCLYNLCGNFIHYYDEWKILCEEQIHTMKQVKIKDLFSQYSAEKDPVDYFYLAECKEGQVCMPFITKYY